MRRQAWGAFFQEVVLGATTAYAFSVVALYVLTTAGVVSFAPPPLFSVDALLDFAYENLRLSVVFFALALVFYARTWARLRRLVSDNEARPEAVAQGEHLLDISVNLFFGIGVLWTAIGMRSALLYALGDAGTMPQQNAFAILERLVDGGILLALSTTIFGGAVGYLLRLFKAISLGTALQRFYDGAARAETERLESVLLRIEAQLGEPARQPAQRHQA